MGELERIGKSQGNGIVDLEHTVKECTPWLIDQMV